MPINQIETGIVWALSVLLALFVGGFLKSYMGRKGENLATYEDIEKLVEKDKALKRGEIEAIHLELGKVVEQNRAITKATEDIKAQISIDVWDRQTQWTLKKETLFELIKTFRRYDRKLAGLILAKEQMGAQGGEYWKRSYDEHSDTTIEVARDFDDAFAVATIAMTANSHGSVGAISIRYNKTLAAIIGGETMSSTTFNRQSAIDQSTIFSVARRELRIFP